MKKLKVYIPKQLQKLVGYSLVALTLILFLSGGIKVGNSLIKRIEVSTILRSLSPEEQYCLEFFLRDLLFQESLAYVIYGDKPIALADYWLPPPTSEHYYLGLSRNKVVFKKGLDLFKKHLLTISYKKFNFIITEMDDYIEIALINKKEVEKTIANNIALFHHVLKSNTTANLLAKELSTQSELFTSLEQHHDLLGVLLGYGVKNAMAFQRKIDVLQKNKEFSLKYRSDGFEEEIESQLQPIDDLYSELTLLPLPRFMADPKELETQAIKQKYIQQRKAVVAAYQDGNFLATTLLHLMQ